ncbi:class I SAM-dependent methyltransferase [Frigoribacterium sp. UYMn621]|jgi:ubiquinone/menaquinone biosynthesis C-methylase UbiE|uniref:class I SAM-dependent methyltransferase n=1 Tax=Frigoribacterium sp. UYMn621 TaxID=3156343 RepID=UPI003397FF7F
MDENRTSEHASSFGRAAGAYDSARPGYPDAAVDWLVPAHARTVLDIGAGTGKFTRSLVRRGFATIAVEPDPLMRQRLVESLPTVQALGGTAEAIPLPDDCVDAVTVAQAWHWVDRPAATAEIARVLRPGGTLGLVWNIRDESVGWVNRLSDIMGSSDAERFIAGDISVGEPFGALEEAQFEWANSIGVESLVNLVASRSYIITATDEVRAAVLSAVRELAASDPALAGRETFELPYRTHCFRAVLG